MGAAVQRGPRRPRGLRAALAGGAAATAAVVAALVLSGGAAPDGASRARDYDGTLAGVAAAAGELHELAHGLPAQRDQAVHALTATIGGASTSGGVGRTLPDRDVAALFGRVCTTPGTSSFVLYLLYARAVAFSRQGHGPTPVTAPAAQPPL